MTPKDCWAVLFLFYCYFATSYWYLFKINYSARRKNEGSFLLIFAFLDNSIKKLGQFLLEVSKQL